MVEKHVANVLVPVQIWLTAPLQVLDVKVAYFPDTEKVAGAIPAGLTLVPKHRR